MDFFCEYEREVAMAMKKFINNPDNLTSELLEGYTMAFSSKVKLVSDKMVCRRNEKAKDKVAIVTLGGAGHEPALEGYVGEGMLDISVVGDIFAAPGPPKVFEALKMADRSEIAFSDSRSVSARGSLFCCGKAGQDSLCCCCCHSVRWL